MTSLTFVRYLIQCEGCQAIFGSREGFESLTEARASAYGAGWRFPSQLTVKGSPSNRDSDVCGECFPTWKPIKSGQKTQGMRMLTKSEVERLGQP